MICYMCVAHTGATQNAKVNYPDYALYAADRRRNAGYTLAHGRF